VLEAATARNLSAYDAQFVVAAADLEVPLVTSDRRLLNACPDIAVTPEKFIADGTST
jgi:predicted nucleic acid-binding protein